LAAAAYWNVLVTEDHKKLREKWNAFYEHHSESEVVSVLAEHAYLLPPSGSALDLACGNGANAMFLAEKGLMVEAWDISDVALNRLTQKARQQQLTIISKQIAVEPDHLPINVFDVIVISRFLDRRLAEPLMQALKPDGLLFYQTFTVNKLTDKGPSNPAYLLARNELLRLFAPLNLLYYQEDDRTGCLAEGDRNEARYIGQKVKCSKFSS
jgi:tellurite methyltransferase